MGGCVRLGQSCRESAGCGLSSTCLPLEPSVTKCQELSAAILSGLSLQHLERNLARQRWKRASQLCAHLTLLSENWKSYYYLKSRHSANTQKPGPLWSLGSQMPGNLRAPPPPCLVPVPPAVANCHLVTLLLYEQLRIAWLGWSICNIQCS